ncbi:Rossmann-like and DUF2520 domain-containing protein [Fusibacter bizertensis]
MNIGFIGAGKVGQSLGLLFIEKDYRLTGFYSRHADNCIIDSRLSEISLYSDLSKIIYDSDVVGITVPDDQIDLVVAEIANLPIDLTAKFFFHTSGAHTIDSLRKISHNVFSMHPLMAFPQVISDLRSFNAIYFGIENLNAFKETGLDQVATHYFEIQSDQKAKYHAAAAIVSNYLVAVIDFGLSQFMELGLDSKEAQKALWPLILNTIENVNSLGTKIALTGPIARGDISTIEAHLNALSQEVLPLYKALGRYTLQMTAHEATRYRNLEKLL